MRKKDLRKYYNKKINKIQNKFEIEKNIKNNLYFFILENKLFNILKKWQRGLDMSKPGGHSKAVQYLKLRFPENTN